MSTQGKAARISLATASIPGIDLVVSVTATPLGVGVGVGQDVKLGQRRAVDWRSTASCCAPLTPSPQGAIRTGGLPGATGPRAPRLTVSLF
jgi:hypothetical protein